MTPKSVPKPAASHSSIAWRTTFAFMPSETRGCTDLDADRTKATLPSRNCPSDSFSSFVLSKSPERSDTTESPKLGSVRFGIARLNPYSEVSSNSCVASNVASFWNILVTPAGFHSIPSGSPTVATYAPPRPIVRAPV